MYLFVTMIALHVRFQANYAHIAVQWVKGASSKRARIMGLMSFFGEGGGGEEILISFAFI